MTWDLPKNSRACWRCCLRNANNELCSQNPLDLFVTVFLGILDPATGVLVYANGGHNPPVLCSPEGQVRWLASTGDIALGVMPDMDYTRATVQLLPADMLISYTDGVTEAFNAELIAYGEEKLLSLIQAHGRASAQDMVECIFKDVAAFASGAAQSDDITIAAISWQAV